MTTPENQAAARATFTLDEIKQGYAELYQNVECMTCARLLAYVKDLLSLLQQPVTSERERELREALDSIIIRCKDGDKGTDWLPIIRRIAERAVENLPATSERCVKCRHENMDSLNELGQCTVRLTTSIDGDGYECGCKCVFPATGAAKGDLTKLYDELASRARLVAYDKKQGINLYAVYINSVDEIFRELAATGAPALTVREKWLLHDVSSATRSSVPVEQYGELRTLARRLAATGAGESEGELAALDHRINSNVARMEQSQKVSQRELIDSTSGSPTPVAEGEAPDHYFVPAEEGTCGMCPLDVLAHPETPKHNFAAPAPAPAPAPAQPTCKCGATLRQHKRVITSNECAVCGYRENVLTEPFQRSDAGEVERLRSERDSILSSYQTLIADSGQYLKDNQQLRAELSAARAERLEIQRALASTVLNDPTEDDNPPYTTSEIVHGITSLDQRRRAAVKRASDARADVIREAVECVPVNWLDTLLTGPDAVLPKGRYEYDGKDIERLLNGITLRMQSLLDKKEGEDGLQS